MIKGLQKISLIDYPRKICSIIFLTKCNFRCGYCHNPELVLDDSKLKEISEEEVLKFLKTREKLIDAVCITGGEPTLHEKLPEFIKKIKELNFLVKLDTNGTNSEMLKYLIKNKLIDFISMDIKNMFEKYEKTVNTKVDETKLKESIKIITKSGLEHEFRTTVLQRLHKKEDLVKIATGLQGAKRYVLQQFIPAEKILDKSFLTEKKYSHKELEVIRKECNKYVKTEIRKL